MIALRLTRAERMVPECIESAQDPSMLNDPSGDIGVQAEGFASSRMTSIISIALCTFNGERFIAEQLSSLASQTRPPGEIVVGDDGSTDNTVEIVEAFAREHPELNVQLLPVSERRLGYRENFFRTALACSGNLIAFCDQDDVWRDDKLEIAAATIEADRSLLFFHDYRVVDEQLRPLYTDRNESRQSCLFPRLTISPWTFPLGFSIVFRRELLQYSSARTLARDPYQPDQPIAHDVWFSLIANLIGETSFSSELLVDYRQHKANAFGASSPNPKGRLALIKRLLRVIDYAALANVAGSIVKAISTLEIADKTALQTYTRIHSAYNARASVYTSRRFVGRLSSWRWLLSQGLYSDNFGVFFSNHAALRDFTLGVLFPFLPRRFGQVHKHDYSLRLEQKQAIRSSVSPSYTRVSSPGSS